VGQNTPAEPIKAQIKAEQHEMTTVIFRMESSEMKEVYVYVGVRKKASVHEVDGDKPDLPVQPRCDQLPFTLTYFYHPSEHIDAMRLRNASMPSPCLSCRVERQLTETMIFRDCGRMWVINYHYVFLDLWRLY
jgi:hypothetical protein